MNRINLGGENLCLFIIDSLNTWCPEFKEQIKTKPSHKSCEKRILFIYEIEFVLGVE